MHIGIDFDNTIVRYDELFHRCALERGLIQPAVPVSKAAVRAAVWSLPDGNTPWTELQGRVYGERMAEALPCAGVKDFFAFCDDAGIRVSIISHKVEYPALGPRVNLHEAAMLWMESQGFFAKRPRGPTQIQVHFEPTREAKVARIQAAGCTCFIDDLPEVFTDPAFPRDVAKLLYAADPFTELPPVDDILVFREWAAIRAHFRSKAGYEEHI